MFRPQSKLDWVFAVGIVAKGLNGAVEVIGGLLLLTLGTRGISNVVVRLTREELSEDPGDFVASHVLHTADGLTGSAVLFGAIYLLAHGIVKVVLVVALLLDKLWAYPWMIVVLGLFIAYQVYRIALGPSAGLIALTVFDLIIVALTFREYAQRRRPRSPAGSVRSLGPS